MTPRFQQIALLTLLAGLAPLASCRDSASVPTWERAAQRFNSNTPDTELTRIVHEIRDDAASHTTFIQATKSMACADRNLLLWTVCATDINKTRWLDVALALDANTACGALGGVFWELPLELQIKHLPVYLAPNEQLRTHAVPFARRTLQMWATVPDWRKAALSLSQETYDGLAKVDTPSMRAFFALKDKTLRTDAERDAFVESLPENLREPFLKALGS